MTTRNRVWIGVAGLAVAGIAAMAVWLLQPSDARPTVETSVPTRAPIKAASPDFPSLPPESGFGSSIHTTEEILSGNPSLESLSRRDDRGALRDLGSHGKGHGGLGQRFDPFDTYGQEPGLDASVGAAALSVEVKRSANPRVKGRPVVERVLEGDTSAD